MTRRKLLIVLVLQFFLPIGCNPPAKPKPQAYVEPYPIGTVFESRNKNEKENTSPGYENHLAMYVGKGQIVESQSGQGVILTSLATWNARDYIWHPRYFRDAHKGAKAAAKCRELVGLPYRASSSLSRVDRHPENGLNCVSTVRIGLVAELGHELPDLHRPDDIDNVVELTVNRP